MKKQLFALMTLALAIMTPGMQALACDTCEELAATMAPDFTGSNQGTNFWQSSASACDTEATRPDDALSAENHDCDTGATSAHESFSDEVTLPDSVNNRAADHDHRSTDDTCPECDLLRTSTGLYTANASMCMRREVEAVVRMSRVTPPIGYKKSNTYYCINGHEATQLLK